MRPLGFILLSVACIAAGLWLYDRYAPPGPWTGQEREIIESLWLGSLPPVPPDTSNTVADDPAAARFGQQLFFDTRFSANGAVACATCHQPERRFTDGLPTAAALGRSKRNTLSIVGAAYSPWLYWDGRRDSLWSQALSPLEDPAEHGSNRHEILALIGNDPDYRRSYESIFGPLPTSADEGAVDRAFANVGKAIAAYERKLLPGLSRFDRYAAALLQGGDVTGLLNDAEIRGLRLFIGEANCTQCHNGPLFTNHEFHNDGILSAPGKLPDKGRVQGVREVLADPFNCLGAFNDDVQAQCRELGFVRTGPELIGAMRTPSLRNLDGTEPFMHQGQMASLGAVLEHYNEAPLAMIGHNEAKPLGLSGRDLRHLEAFLGALQAPLATDDEWLRPPAPRLASKHQQSD